MQWPWEDKEYTDGAPITREQIFDKLQMLWLELIMGRTSKPGHAWFMDINYWMPTLKDVKEVIAVNVIDQLPYIKGAWDCDDFAAALSQHIRTIRRDKVPWSFFECAVTKLNGKDTVHAVNLVLTVEGLYFIEPQRDTFRLASAENDKPYFIR